MASEQWYLATTFGLAATAGTTTACGSTSADASSSRVRELEPEALRLLQVAIVERGRPFLAFYRRVVGHNFLVRGREGLRRDRLALVCRLVATDVSFDRPLRAGRLHCGCCHRQLDGGLAQVLPKKGLSCVCIYPPTCATTLAGLEHDQRGKHSG